MLVPDLTARLTLLGASELYRARTAADLQRLKSDRRPVPTAGREFSRTERLLVRVPVYGPGGTTPTLTARLLNRAGQPMADLPVLPPDTSRSFPQFELSFANLAAGEYGIALTATGNAGAASDVIAFRITP